tara:strand:- start:661 stop:849 length:189 start_codon:yes stop_codon:yes gene_type:complete
MWAYVMNVIKVNIKMTRSVKIVQLDILRVLIVSVPHAAREVTKTRKDSRPAKIVQQEGSPTT